MTDPDDDRLSLREAVQRYNVSLSTLALRLRVGEIPGTKVRGPRKDEWRVAVEDLEAAGYELRPTDGVELQPDLPSAIRHLQHLLAEERRTVAYQAVRINQLESQVRNLQAARRGVRES